MTVIDICRETNLAQITAIKDKTNLINEKIQGEFERF